MRYSTIKLPPWTLVDVDSQLHSTQQHRSERFYCIARTCCANEARQTSTTLSATPKSELRSYVALWDEGLDQGFKVGLRGSRVDLA